MHLQEDLNMGKNRQKKGEGDSQMVQKMGILHLAYIFVWIGHECTMKIGLGWAESSRQNDN